MTSFEIDASELRAFAAGLERKAEAATFLIRGAVRKTTADIAADAKRLAPVDTGFLRSSIQTSSAGSNANVAQGTVQAQSEYSKYVEFGTSRTAPQPFMGPAADGQEQNLQQAVSQILGQLGEGL
ncbi:HK97-gp10 family putative phage morphogenesis protein [Arthrobacter sp. ISL-69]|uniref:HK97-gp10 family putative phage morphogenesis protein n=1 Tax=Arthrobacter sp. ISL-69 TaxID=2819113 RepID=UPI001BEA9B00|nr:HK97-gp10 family putative phage morphogenesis protein [Arthrobacter sp. ISL-69]MBT2538677.1 HK97 gp10 family phage protein [Arthrobacter sp. ISL-69]